MAVDPLKQDGDNEMIRPKLVLWAAEQHDALRSSSETPSSNLVMRCGVFSPCHINLFPTKIFQEFIYHRSAILWVSSLVVFYLGIINMFVF